MARLSRRATLVLLAAGSLSATACVADGDADAGGQGALRLAGTVRSVANDPLPVGTVTIRLEDQGVMDAPAQEIAIATVVSKGDRPTVSFEMMVPRDKLAKAVDPGFTIRLERDGRLTATNTSKQRYSGGSTVSLEIEPILY